MRFVETESGGGGGSTFGEATGVKVETPVQEAWESLSIQRYLDIERRMRVAAAVDELSRMQCPLERYLELARRKQSGDTLASEEEQLFQHARERLQSLDVNPEDKSFFDEEGVPLSVQPEEVKLLVPAHKRIAANGVRPTQEELSELADLAGRGDGMNNEAPLAWALTVRAHERAVRLNEKSATETPVPHIPEWSRTSLADYLACELRMRTAAAVEQLDRIGCNADMYVRYAARVASGGKLSASEFDQFAQAQKILRDMGLDTNFPRLHDRQGNVVMSGSEDVKLLVQANKHLAANGLRPSRRELATLRQLADNGHADMPLSEIEHVLLDSGRAEDDGKEHVEAFQSPASPQHNAHTTTSSPVQTKRVFTRMWNKVTSFFRR